MEIIVIIVRNPVNIPIGGQQPLEDCCSTGTGYLGDFICCDKLEDVLGEMSLPPDPPPCPPDGSQ
jgi:hypothetical protein